MAYNYYPYGYNPYYPTQNMPNFSDPQIQQTINPSTANAVKNGIIWVQGEAGAKAYPVAPNTTVQLWDSESQSIFLKSADASGMPSMKILDYTIRDNSIGKSPVADMSGYVTRDEFEKRLKEITTHEPVVSANGKSE